RGGGFMRIIPVIAAAAALLLPCVAQAADCKLQIADTLPLLHIGSQRFVPVTVNGAQEYFLFDTGGFYTQVSRSTADALKLQVHQGNRQMYDVTGNISRDEATIHEFLF